MEDAVAVAKFFGSTGNLTMPGVSSANQELGFKGELADAGSAQWRCDCALSFSVIGGPDRGCCPFDMLMCLSQAAPAGKRRLNHSSS